MDLNGKVVVVTGAVGNLGRATVDVVKNLGATVVAADRSQDRLDATFGAPGVPADMLLLGGIDLAYEQGAEALVNGAVDRFGRVDGLVNTVGGFRGGKTLSEEDLATWDAMMTVNLRTTLLACRAVVPVMLGQGSGAIVNVSSGAAHSGPARLAAYSASKAAVLRLSESLASETKAHGVRVNAVLPGTIDTPQNREAMPKADTSKWVPPEDIATVIAFLLSNGARAVTGAAVPVLGRA